MTFTYTVTAPYTDLARVRFHLGDVDSTSAMFTDEEIAFQISEQTTWKPAVIALLESLIARVSMTPDFQLGMLRVSQDAALKHFEALLARKRSEFGVATITATTGYVWRPDSNQTEAPTFDAATDDEDDD